MPLYAVAAIDAFRHEILMLHHHGRVTRCYAPLPLFCFAVFALISDFAGIKDYAITVTPHNAASMIITPPPPRFAARYVAAAAAADFRFCPFFITPRRC